jgi:hypothetical protein
VLSGKMPARASKMLALPGERVSSNGAEGYYNADCRDKAEGVWVLIPWSGSFAAALKTSFHLPPRFKLECFLKNGTLGVPYG